MLISNIRNVETAALRQPRLDLHTDFFLLVLLVSESASSRTNAKPQRHGCQASPERGRRSPRRESKLKKTETAQRQRGSVPHSRARVPRNASHRSICLARRRIEAAAPPSAVTTTSPSNIQWRWPAPSPRRCPTPTRRWPTRRSTRTTPPPTHFQALCRRPSRTRRPRPFLSPRRRHHRARRGRPRPPTSANRRPR